MRTVKLLFVLRPLAGRLPHRPLTGAEVIDAVLTARAAVWTRALTELGLATVEPLKPADAPAAWLKGLPYDVSPTRAHWLRPQRTGAQPLLISYRGFDGCEDNIVAVSTGEPAVLLASLPFCGCDACDDGSDPLLEQLDAAVVDVVNGQVVHVVTPHGEVIGHESGWEAEGFASPEDAEQVLDDARADRSPHRVVRGRPCGDGRSGITPTAVSPDATSGGQPPDHQTRHRVPPHEPVPRPQIPPDHSASPPDSAVTSTPPTWPLQPPLLSPCRNLTTLLTRITHRHPVLPPVPKILSASARVTWQPCAALLSRPAERFRWRRADT
ncbi:hypothetical protein F1544_05185 [Kineosporiaceae bacterium B12]|nr:hypothetical protein [Kineococcus rubinsiae]